MLDQHLELTNYIRGRLAKPFGERPDTGWDKDPWYDRTVMGRLDRRLDRWRTGEETDEEFVPLLGQLVRYLGDGAQVEIRLRAGQTKPDWSRFGLKVAPDGSEDGGLFVECALADLEWITQEQADAVRKACRQGIAERPGPVAGDSWLLDTKHGRELPGDRVPTYKTAGQRELLRAVDRMPPGDVLMGTLTTGEGKSLVIHRLITKDPQKVTVVVVPTVALALDQEKEARDVVGQDALGHPLAYIGGQEQDQACIRERLENGTQRVVFTCPESLRGLMALLRQSAKEGRMAALVVDEAHVIATDGWQFRPDFAWIPSMCAALSKAATGSASPPRFVLLSATYTQATHDALCRWFGGVGQGPVRTAGSLRLRGEMVSVCEQIVRKDALDDHEQRMRRLRQIVPILPRPFYIYATKPDDVENIGAMLKELGIRRAGQVHGATTVRQKGDVIDRLKDGQLDAVSANSAFGLGLNVSNVRAVVHACVPDGLDRYYQEMGRGGRDGRHALAWWMWCSSDLGVAKSQAFTKVLNEAGFRRWQNMWKQRVRSPQGGRCVWLPIAAGAIIEPNERHEDWDICCLVLMEAAGLLEFVWDVVPPDEVDRFQSLCVRRLTDDHLSSAEEWKAKTDSVRAQIHRTNAAAFEAMTAVLHAQAAFWPSLSAAYGLEIENAGMAQPALWGDHPSSVPILLRASRSGTASAATDHGVVRVNGTSAAFVVAHFESLLRWRAIGQPVDSIMRLVFQSEIEADVAPLVRQARARGLPLQLQFVYEDAQTAGAHLVRIWSDPIYECDLWEQERGEATTSLLVLSRAARPPVAHRDIRDYLIGLIEHCQDSLRAVVNESEDMEDFF